jgi:hypothetical protein
MILKVLILKDKNNFKIWHGDCFIYGMAKHKYNLYLEDRKTKQTVIHEEGKVNSSNWYQAITEIKSLSIYALYGHLDHAPRTTDYYGQLRIHTTTTRSGSNTFFDAIKLIDLEQKTK